MTNTMVAITIAIASGDAARTVNTPMAVPIRIPAITPVMGRSPID